MSGSVFDDPFAGSTMADLPVTLPASTGSPYASDAAIASMNSGGGIAGGADPFGGNTMGSGGFNFGSAMTGLNNVLQGLSKSGTGSGAGAAGSNPMGQVPNVSGAIVHPAQAAMGQSRSPTSLDSLLQMLMQRRNAYLAATNPQSAKPVDTGIPSGKGLLGL